MHYNNVIQIGASLVSNRVCKACSALGPIAVASPDEPCVGKRGPSESIHTGPLQPGYAAIFSVQFYLKCAVILEIDFL